MSFSCPCRASKSFIEHYSVFDTCTDKRSYYITKCISVTKPEVKL